MRVTALKPDRNFPSRLFVLDGIIPSLDSGEHTLELVRCGILLMEIVLSSRVVFNGMKLWYKKQCTIIERWSSMSKPTVLLFGGMLMNQHFLQKFRALYPPSCRFVAQPLSIMDLLIPPRWNPKFGALRKLVGDPDRVQVHLLSAGIFTYSWFFRLYPELAESVVSQVWDCPARLASMQRLMPGYAPAVTGLFPLVRQLEADIDAGIGYLSNTPTLIVRSTRDRLVLPTDYDLWLARFLSSTTAQCWYTESKHCRTVDTAAAEYRHRIEQLVSDDSGAAHSRL